jgi:hypothetical protein
MTKLRRLVLVFLLYGLVIYKGSNSFNIQVNYEVSKIQNRS